MLLAIFSANGFTSLHPSVEEGDSHSNFLPSRLNLSSTVRIRSDCSGTVVCTVDDTDESGVEIGRRQQDDDLVARETVFKQRGRGVAFRCAPAQTCSNYSVEWFLDGKLLSSGSFYAESDEDAILNSDLVAWSHDELWMNDTGPWIRSPNGCLSCRVEACGVKESAELCGAWEPVERSVSPTFSSMFCYVVYALFIAYITN